MPDGSQIRPRVCDVPIAHLPFIWPQARGFVGDALDRGGGGRFTLGDILSLLLEGKARLWISWDGHRVEGAAVTETIHYPQLKELRIWLVGGRNLKAWVYEMRDMIEAFARAEGCTILGGGLRRGWVRIGGNGWHETGAMFEKRLT